MIGDAPASGKVRSNAVGRVGQVGRAPVIQENSIAMQKFASPRAAHASSSEEKHAALRYILDAWEEAVYDGLDPDCLATAAIFAALSDMIATYGEEPVAAMCGRLPERIRMGEFTVSKTKQ
jgi:predicted YcjX-like family ATPase